VHERASHGLNTVRLSNLSVRTHTQIKLETSDQINMIESEKERNKEGRVVESRGGLRVRRTLKRVLPLML
jgi:hypothetical protein